MGLGLARDTGNEGLSATPGLLNSFVQFLDENSHWSRGFMAVNCNAHFKIRTTSHAKESVTLNVDGI